MSNRESEQTLEMKSARPIWGTARTPLDFREGGERYREERSEGSLCAASDRLFRRLWVYSE